jgi:hemoglobin
MNHRASKTGILAIVLITTLSVTAAFAGDGQTAAAKSQPSVAEQVGALETMCADTEQARTQRHSDDPLYNRLGGYDRIHDLTREIVRLHKVNPDIKQMFTYVDGERLAKHVADFMSAGTGGTQTYTGRTMPAAHANLELTDADFVSAGGDIVTAMQSKGYGQNEIEEVVCILVSLKDQVVLK